MDIEKVNRVLTQAIVEFQDSEIENLFEYGKAKPYSEANFVAVSDLLSQSLAEMVNHLSVPIAAWKKELSGMGGYEKAPAHAPRAAVNSIDKLQGLIDRVTGVKKDSKMDALSAAMGAIEKKNWKALDRLMGKGKVKGAISHLSELLGKIGLQARKVKKNVQKHLKTSSYWSKFETGINLVYHDNNPLLRDFREQLDSYTVSKQS
jgi:hypothetical protein